MLKFALSLVILLTTALPAYADITIGVAGPMSGENAFLGDWLKHGAELAVADINAKGGVNGEKLVLQIVDDACDPKQAVVAANKLISQGIKFVVGHACSATSIPAVKVYAEENVLMITPISTNPAVTDAGYKYVFRTTGRDDQQGAAVANYILKHLKGKKIAVTNDQSAWGVGISTQVKKTLNEAGVKEELFDSFAASANDYSAFISRLKEKGIEVAFLGGYYRSVGLIARQMKEQNAPIQILGGDGIFTKELWSITGSAGEGILSSFAADPRKLPEAKSVVDEYNKKGIDPDGQTLNAYAAVQVIVEGIKRAGKADPIQVSGAIRQAPVDTVIGKLPYDAKGDVKDFKYVIYRWHDGNYAEVDE